MRLVAWNINHRIRSRPIAPAVADALISLAPDFVILTEYVEHPSHVSFFDRLAVHGLSHVAVSDFVPDNNRVAIVSKSELTCGSIKAPAIAEAVPSNALHVSSPKFDIEVLGLRLPDFSKQPAIRRAWWDWLLPTAAAVVDRPFIIAGDLNTDACYSKARCGDRLHRMTELGWQHAAPVDGFSFWTLTGIGRRIDHAFLSPHFRIVDARYFVEAAGRRLVGKPAEALSDHAALVVDFGRRG